MCEFHDSNSNGLGDMWWTDQCTYFSSIDGTHCGADELESMGYFVRFNPIDHNNK